VIYETH
jgi:hypothetical protein